MENLAEKLQKKNFHSTANEKIFVFNTPKVRTTPIFAVIRSERKQEKRNVMRKTGEKGKANHVKKVHHHVIIILLQKIF